ncbi:MAG TPA: SCO family protein [Thermoanaerobaculia bacterium]|nr:SCO family protein [Thermoanaerobaculia bacterium]
MKTALVLLFTFLSFGVLAQQPADPAAHYFANLRLVDQNGRSVDLYNDVMKGHTVVINSFFATCQASCLVMDANYAHLQKQFKDLRLVSITVDPANDTPAALKAYAQRMKAGEGWLFLTGSKEQVHAALAKLGLAVDARDAHSNVLLAGNLKTGLWKKIFGLAKAEDIATAVQSVVEDVGGGKGAE